MFSSFDISSCGRLLRYSGMGPKVVIPDGVTEIAPRAFRKCRFVTSVVIPEGVTEIGEHAFEYCEDLTSITIPDSVKKIGGYAFIECRKLESVRIPDGVTEIGSMTFYHCYGLTSVTIPDSVTEIGDEAFWDCSSLRSIHIPCGVTRIGILTFGGCRDLTSINLHWRVTEIDNGAFSCCSGLPSIDIPDSVTRIGRDAFDGCRSLSVLVIPDSVTEFGENAFPSQSVTIVCGEGSCAHRYCAENRISYIFDYQYKAFHGIIPSGFEMLSSPFQADEEKPYIFVSYSHKDRDEVLGIIKELYEAGWRIWYDEGLTIGDSYDKTLEEHVKECSAFLLFVTGNSLNSYYIKTNEIPWAVRYGRPIIKCALDEGLDCRKDSGSAFAEVTRENIESGLEMVSGLTKGERREAKGISVAVNPTDRNESNDGGFAYCIYYSESSASAKAIILEAKNGGCTVYNAVEDGEDEERLLGCACLVVFLNRAFLADKHLTQILTDAYTAGRDIAVCQLEDIGDGDLPEELAGLHRLHWLNFAHGITADMNTKLAQYLERRGCRDSAVLPGFEYEKTDRGIVIIKYTGNEPEPKLRSEYGGSPLIEISKEAFINCVRLKKLAIPDGVTTIGEGAFKCCSGLTGVDIPDSVKDIGKGAFEQCSSLISAVVPKDITVIRESTFNFCDELTSAVLPDGLTEIESYAFASCGSLSSIAIPDGVTKIGKYAFEFCNGLKSINIPDSVTELGAGALARCDRLRSVAVPNSVTVLERGLFYRSRGLASIAIPDSVTVIETYAFKECVSLTSVTVPESVTGINEGAFESCTGLVSVTLPDSLTEIGPNLFKDCSKQLTVYCSRGSAAWKYCRKNRVRVEDPAEASRPGFFGRLLVKK